MFYKRCALGVLGVSVAALMTVAAPNSARALCTTPFGDGGAALQAVLNGITTAPVAGSSSTNVATDCLSDGSDSRWAIGGTGGSVATVVIELAGFAGSNTFGIWDGVNSANRVQIFGGAATTGSQALVSILADGSVFLNFADTFVDFGSNNFGYYLDATVGNGVADAIWFSETAFNADGVDHMAAYEGGKGDTIQILPFSPGVWGANEFILAFEDLDCRTGCDRDFTDFVVIVESVTPRVPEPATLGLFGAGLIGMGVMLRRRRNKKAA